MLLTKSVICINNSTLPVANAKRWTSLQVFMFICFFLFNLFTSYFTFKSGKGGDHSNSINLSVGYRQKKNSKYVVYESFLL